MRFRESYDWVVLGDNPGALLSASLVARLGLSVLVLPFLPAARLRISPTNQIWDPESNFLIGLGRVERSRGLLFEILSKVGILPSEVDKILREDSLPQSVTSRHRLAFTLEDEVFQHELIREFGERILGRMGLPEVLSHAELPIQLFWRNLSERLSVAQPKSHRHEEPSTLKALRERLVRTVKLVNGNEPLWFKEGRQFSDLAQDESTAEELEDVFMGLLYGISGGLHQKVQLSDLLHLMAIGRTGARFRGGITSYRNLLLRLAKRQGAQIVEKEDCRRIFIESGRLVGVQIAHQGNMVSVSGGVLGCCLSQAENVLSTSGRKWFVHLHDSPRPEGWRFTVSLTLAKAGLPPGMHSRVVWKEPGAPVLEIEVNNPDDYGVVVSDTCIISVRTILPFLAETLDFEYQRMIAARMLRQVAEVIPFFDVNILGIYPDFRSNCNEFSEIYGFGSLDNIPENLRCFSKHGVGSRSGVEGLFVASGESYPELGSLGGTVAALEATAWIAHRCGLSGPFA